MVQVHDKVIDVSGVTDSFIIWTVFCFERAKVRRYAVAWSPGGVMRMPKVWLPAMKI